MTDYMKDRMPDIITEYNDDKITNKIKDIIAYRMTDKMTK